MLIGPNSPVGNFSLMEVAELQFNYILQLIDHAIETDRSEIEATKGTIWVTGCRSWYLNADGIPAAWPWTLQQFGTRCANQISQTSNFEGEARDRSTDLRTYTRLHFIGRNTTWR